MGDQLTWSQVIMFWVVVTLGMLIAYNQSDDRTNFIDILVCIGLICVTGLRHGYIDTRAYRNSFINLDVSEVFSFSFLTDTTQSEKGFNIFQAIIKLFTNNSQVYLFILSALTIGMLFGGIVKRVPDRRVGIYLLIMTGCFVDTMDGARQYLVAAFLFYFLPKLIKERKLYQYVIVVLIASTIHGTALIFLPIYFVADRKPWSISTVILSVIVLFAFIFYNSGVGRFIANILEGTSYGDDYGEMLLAGNTSTNWLRVPIAFAPLVLSFLNRNIEKDEPFYNIAFNMGIMNAACWLLSQRALYFYRLAIYFSPFMILLLCYEFERAYERRGDNQVQYVALILYTAMHIYSTKVMEYLLFVGYLRY